MSPSYRRIPLNETEYALVDEADFERVSQLRWTLRTYGNGRYKYALHRKGHSGKKGRILMHRFILDAPSHLIVDHINHNGLDNRRSNLRLATRSQNMMNRRSNHNSKCEFKGVYYDAGKSAWSAEIRANGARYALGTHSTPEEAAVAYDIAANTLHGEFAVLNFPDRADDYPPFTYRSFTPRSRHGYRGVCRNYTKWSAEIRHNGERFYLGVFDTPEEAALAYDEAAVRLKGDKAILNFPERRIA